MNPRKVHEVYSAIVVIGGMVVVWGILAYAATAALLGF
jgi:uncharacterized membrane protein